MEMGSSKMDSGTVMHQSSRQSSKDTINYSIKNGEKNTLHLAMSHRTFSYKKKRENYSTIASKLTLDKL